LITLVISDLHLGTSTRGDVLRTQTGLDALTAGLSDCRRLVILGDLLELRHGPEREARAAAAEPLAAIAEALGPEHEVVIVPGNHDHALLSSWLGRRGHAGPPPPLGTQTEVEFSEDELLGELAAHLRPASVSVAYPGIWLRDDVYALHGHYGDLHLSLPTLERLGAGAMTRITGLSGDGPRSSDDYELVLAPIYAWIHALAQRLDPELSGHMHGGSVRGWQALTDSESRPVRRWAMAAGFPVLVGALNRMGLGDPLRPELSGQALRRSGLRGCETVLGRLGISAPYVIFGHTHRAGPLPGDERSEWLTRSGTALYNSGCWVDEPAFHGPDPARSPYRPGFAVRLDDEAEGRAPELVNLLDQPPVPG
jgi:predicted MPP superfamily phosphohydrolase